MAEQQAQDQQENKSHGPSVFDRASGAARKAQSTYRNIKRLKKAAQAARLAAQAIVALAGGGEIVLLVIIIILGLILLVAVIMTFFTGTPNANAGQICHTETITTGGTTTSNMVTPMAIADVAKRISISGDGVTASQKQVIYKMFSVPLGSTRYDYLLTRNGRRTIYVVLHYLNNGTLTGGAEYTQSRPEIRGWGFFQAQINNTMKAHWLIHEAGHLLSRLNNNIANGSTSYGGDRYSRTSLISQDPTCYDAVPSNSDDYISTYSYRDADNIGGGANSESFADSLSNNVFCKPGASCNLNDYNYARALVYNHKCDATYDWFKKNIFGGDDFFTSGTVPATTTRTICVNPTPVPNSAPVAGSTEFENLVRRQGRNINALGSGQQAFINTAINNIGGRGWNYATNRSYLAKIYNEAISKDVNPVMLLVIWGVEASWRLNGTEFGVISQRGSGFDNQLANAVGILNRWMNVFSQNNKNGVLSVHGCTFNDMFMYAYEMYTPVCYVDGNDPQRKNFVSFYKVIMGL